MNDRRKLIGSMVVLGVLLAIAAIWQIRGVESTSIAEFAAGPKPERTVFGAKPADRDPEIRPRAAPDESVRSRTADSTVPGDISEFLDRWRSTLISGNAAAHANLYARKVNRFFTRRNVSRHEVRREKQRMLARYPEFRKYEITDVQVERVDDKRAVISFRKDWDACGRGRFAGSEQQRLTLMRESGSWKITSEEETRVYWVRRS